ncbi:hypothetical protein TSUD_308950 [Trifolium subterraneum]|nr:hypothetical protein TSUD_308950 [Trifolium subterraneum]
MQPSKVHVRKMWRKCKIHCLNWRIRKGLLEDIIDPIVFLDPQATNDGWILSSIHKVAELAFRCLAFHRDMRPCMTEVATELEQLSLNQWSSFGENSSIIDHLSSCSSSSSSSESEKPLSSNTTLKDVGPKGSRPMV